jgi:hypothetical protein
MTPDQQAAGPQAGAAIFLSLEIGQFQIGPIVEPLTLGAGIRRQTRPGLGFEAPYASASAVPAITGCFLQE